MSLSKVFVAAVVPALALLPAGEGFDRKDTDDLQQWAEIRGTPPVIHATDGMLLESGKRSGDKGLH